jgi:peptidoglycan/LPS O-acetylase OafA/YrhL
VQFGLGAWRLFLALLVALSHLWASMLHGPAAYAVWGFFVLSGFLMAFVLQQKYGYSFAGLRAYAGNRFLRIFPGFWVACLAGAAVLWWLQQRGVDARQLNPGFGTPRDAAEWGFVLTLLPAFPRWNAPVPVANALSIEVGYYLLMPFMARSRSTAWFGLVFGAMVVADFGLATETFDRRYAWFLPAAPAFALGALVCHYRHALSRLAAPRLSVLAWLAHCGVVAVHSHWPWTYGLYASALLSAWVVISLSPLQPGRVDTVLGELSYPFYLLHSTAGALLLAWFGYGRPGLFAMLALLLTLAASWAMVVLLDRPLTRRKRPPVLPQRTAAAATPAAVAAPEATSVLPSPAAAALVPEVVAVPVVAELSH